MEQINDLYLLWSLGGLLIQIQKIMYYSSREM